MPSAPTNKPSIKTNKKNGLSKYFQKVNGKIVVEDLQKIIEKTILEAIKEKDKNPF